VSPTATEWRELARKTTDGIDAALLWNESMNRVKVTVTGERLGHHLEFDLADPDAIRAFSLPFADVATRLALANRPNHPADKGAIT
jgi:hypothetical protein